MIRSYLRTLFHICFRTTLGICISLALLLVVVLILSAMYSRRVERLTRIQPVPSDEIQPPKTYSFPSAPQPKLTQPAPPRVIVSTNAPVLATNIGTQFRAQNLPSPRKRNNLTAPSRSELRCALTSAAISGASPAPIRAIVTEDFYHNEILLVPKFTKVFGDLTGATDGERLLTQPEWKLVFPDTDFETVLAATPTYRFEPGADPNDALKEGGAGLWGFRFNNLSSEEAKLFASTFLSAVAQSIQSTRASAFGYILKDSAKNSAAEGLAAVLNKYSKRIDTLLEQDQTAILCPPGTPFWLSVEQPLSIPPSAIAAQSLESPYPFTANSSAP